MKTLKETKEMLGVKKSTVMQSKLFKWYGTDPDYYPYVENGKLGYRRIKK